MPIARGESLKVKHKLRKDSISCLHIKGAPKWPLKSSETASFLPFPHKTHCVADGASFPEEEEKGGEDDVGKEGAKHLQHFPFLCLSPS